LSEIKAPIDGMGSQKGLIQVTAAGVPALREPTVSKKKKKKKKRTSMRAAGSDTRIEVFTQTRFNLPHDLSQTLSEGLYAPHTKKIVSDVQRYFQRQRTLTQFDDLDGASLAHMLFNSVEAATGGEATEVQGRSLRGTKKSALKKGLRARAVERFFEKSAGLSVVKNRQPWLVPMLVHIIENKPWPQIKKVDTKLSDITPGEGERIGKR
jgi:hypothetical protein